MSTCTKNTTILVAFRNVCAVVPQQIPEHLNVLLASVSLRILPHIKKKDKCKRFAATKRLREFTGTEVSLGPGRENNLAVRLATLGKGKREGGRAADNLAVLVVLAAVAGAAELVGRLVPGHNAAQVSANSVDTELLELLVVVDDEVSGITLQALNEGAVASGVGLKPLLEDNVIAEGILGDEACKPKKIQIWFSTMLLMREQTVVHPDAQA